MEYNGHILRHEQKYLITYHDYRALRATLEKLMPRDEHCPVDGYFIRSLYFDDALSGAYREKDAGVRRRRKHRLRIYDLSAKFAKYEVKDKFDSYISKTSSPITRDQAEKLIDGCFDGMLCPKEADCIEAGCFDAVTYDEELQRMKCIKTAAERADCKKRKSIVIARNLGFIDARTKLLRPKVIVDYEREAFVCKEGNVRVTFDKHIRAGISSFDIFDPNVPTVPAIEDDRLVLEVKYDEYLPVYIAQMMRQLSRWQTTQSKYIMCVDAKNTYYRKDVPYGSFQAPSDSGCS